MKRYAVELGNTIDSNSIVDLLIKNNHLSISDLSIDRTCDTLELENYISEGKLGTVYDSDEKDVVIKEFGMRDKFKIKDGIILLSSSLNEVVISAFIHKFSNGDNFSVTFPRFRGFLSCGKTGYIAMEKLDMTMVKLIKQESSSSIFKNLLFQILYSVQFLIENKLMHNDLHIDNVMVRSTKDYRYREINLSSVKDFAFEIGSKTYILPNMGYVVKLIDYDFAAKFSEPKICPEKIFYEDNDDRWNLRYRFSKAYDTITILAFIVYYGLFKTKNMSSKNRNDVVNILKDVCEFVVELVIKNGHTIEITKEHESYSQKDPIFGKFMALVSVREFRCKKKYENLDLADILNIKPFKEYFHRKTPSFMVASIK